MDQIRRGDVFYVDFDPVIGSEQGGRRPALVIQNDPTNESSPVLIVAAITSKRTSQIRPTNIQLDPSEGELRLPSTVMLNQIRTIDKQRLGRYVGHLAAERMSEVDEAILLSLGIEADLRIVGDENAID